MFPMTKDLENFLNDKITDYSQIGKHAGKRDITVGKSLDNLAAISVGLASRDDVRALSYGEVLISETINYRTQRPERGWLFCEQIFGPRKNYECACGKYKRIRYKWVICERCGVEVTTSQVRRQRTGHIELAAPVAHIWYLKSVPSRIGLMLDISVKKLEQIIYFASYIVTDVYEDKRDEAIAELENAYKNQKITLQKELQTNMNELTLQLEEKKISKKEFHEIEAMNMRRLDELEAEYAKLRDLLKSLSVAAVIGELDYRILYNKFPHVFKGGTGAEYLKALLERIDLKEFIAAEQAELRIAPKTKQKKILQKLKLASSLFKSGQRPENFILHALQILPPDLRPMIQLDGGRFASSDLNDLYRRVINRNNRLRKLSELGAPEVILKNEKRMLQEAVDMLLNGDVRSNRPGYTTATKKKLKSLADILKGKQGRFRQNLLGKRVDYSGRSVIVVGPELEMNECGLPKSMALTLFKPFVIGRLIETEMAYNVKHAEKIIEEKTKEVWDTLDEVIDGKYVLLNRAPTLHRLGIQAFRPVLIDGKAIRLHPLCCTAFNADFDWDQMAVHLPLTIEAQNEASSLMVTSKNMLNPSNGEPIVMPSQDMILGCYYLTKMDAWEATLVYGSGHDAISAYENGIITLHTPIKIRINGKIIDTTYGRFLFNDTLPECLQYVNETVGKSGAKKILSRSFDLLGGETTAYLADAIKNLGFKYATLSGLTVSAFDMIIPEEKYAFVAEGEEKIKEIQKAFWHGLLTDDERYLQSLQVWSIVKSRIEKEMKKNFNPKNPIYNLVDSGARGNWWNVTQLCGMKGLVVSPTGKTIELPIKSNLKEGFSTLEYFIATHGGRKGKADTALKTAQSGYLTRRLVDAAQNVLIREHDCGTIYSEEFDREEEKTLFGDTFENKIFGKFTAKDVFDAQWKVVIPEWTLISKEILRTVLESSAKKVTVRSILTCETEEWVCQRCYGLDLATSELVRIGTPAGIIAAQSIGEPGTQLTMRTFHSGWVAKEGGDITAGLSRVEELFEARNPKYQAEISPFDGYIVSIESEGNIVHIEMEANEKQVREYYFSDESMAPVIAKGDTVEVKQIIAKSKESKQKVQATHAGRVIKITENTITIEDLVPERVIYETPTGRNLRVKEGDKIKIGSKLTEGHINLQSLMDKAGVVPTELYIVGDIKEIYSSQGQTVNAKHIELIVRQMFSKIKITNAGDSTFFPGDIVDIIRFRKENRELAKAGEKEAIGIELLLGLTKISLFTESWLSAASFQETVRVLVDASTSRKVDYLDGLKENVIIGRLIPTLNYFENNRDVGEFFSHKNDGNHVDDYTELEITTASTSLV
jgi:DNA-directed RNA polymerase subunit beta'